MHMIYETNCTTVIVSCEGIYYHCVLDDTQGTASIMPRFYFKLMDAIEALINPEEYTTLVALNSGLALLCNPRKMYATMKKAMKYSSFTIKTNKEIKHEPN